MLGEFLEIFTGHKFLGVEGALKCVHFYDNQYEAAKEIVKREKRIDRSTKQRQKEAGGRVPPGELPVSQSEGQSIKEYNRQNLTLKVFKLLGLREILG